MLVGVGKGRDQSTLAQLHNGSVTVLLWQLIANIDDAAAVLHQITADLVAWIDGENVHIASEKENTEKKVVRVVGKRKLVSQCKSWCC